ncbi:MAG: hypothetical protein JJD98_06265 [Polaromonas sp.]|nr:hypothetical protein [Polaromonas sp.]
MQTGRGSDPTGSAAPVSSFALFAIVLGSALAAALLRLHLDASGLYWTGVLTSVGVSTLSLGTGAQVLLLSLKVAPARLSRSRG